MWNGSLNDSASQLGPDWKDVAFAYFCHFMSVAGLTINAVLSGILYRKLKLEPKFTPGYYLFSMCAADATSLILFSVSQLMEKGHAGNHISNPILLDLYCRFVTYFAHVATAFSMWTLAALSITAYVAIFKPVMYHMNPHIRRPALILVGLILFTFLLEVWIPVILGHRPAADVNETTAEDLGEKLLCDDLVYGQHFGSVCLMFELCLTYFMPAVLATLSTSTILKWSVCTIIQNKNDKSITDNNNETEQLHQIRLALPEDEEEETNVTTKLTSAIAKDSLTNNNNTNDKCQLDGVKKQQRRSRKKQQKRVAGAALTSLDNRFRRFVLLTVIDLVFNLPFQLIRLSNCLQDLMEVPHEQRVDIHLNVIVITYILYYSQFCFKALFIVCNIYSI